MWLGKYILHGKSLLVVSTGDFKDVALEFISNRVSRDFLANLTQRQQVEGDNHMLERESTLLSMNARKRRSSSISMSFWVPLAG